MPILIEKHCRNHPAPADGARILVMRYWPRGCKKEAFDDWHRPLSPSPELLNWIKEQGALGPLVSTGFEKTWRERYVEEMKAQELLINDLRARHEAGETLTLLCSCHDQNECHRQVLRDVIAGNSDPQYGPNQLSLFR